LALKIIYIDLDNEDDAYLIFETMNTRGKDLEPSDLIKGHLTKLLKPANKNVDLAKDSWNKLVSTIEDSNADLNVTSFLHHYWLSRHEYVTVKKMYRDFKNKIKKEHAKALLAELLQDGVIYRQLQETSFRKWKNEERALKESLDALGIFRVKQPLPMMLAVMHLYDAGDLPLKYVARVLAALENFHFIFTAVTSQRSSGGISFMYALHARQLVVANDLATKQKVIAALIAKLKERIPPYQEFEANFKRLSFSNQFTKQRRLIRYVLRKFDQAGNSGVVIDYDQMTIEHLASQSSGLPMSIYANIGNLLFAEKGFNARTLKNKTFLEKKALLDKSKIHLDKSIEKATSWGKPEVEIRAREMSKSAYDEIWKI
jgi:hypothetical protein